MIEQTELSRADKLVQWGAIISGGLGVLVLAVFVGLLWMAGDRPVSQFDAGRTGQIGDFVGGVSGSLFALAAGLLFYLTLTLQRREFKNSLTELQTSSTALKRTVRNQRKTLLIMRQEKEFSVCLTAVQNTTTELEEFVFGQSNGSIAVSALVEFWNRLVSKGTQEGGNTDAGVFLEMRNIEEIFRGFDKIEALNVHMYWTLHAINMKEIANDDRDYLNSLISPVIHSLVKAQGTLVLIQQMMVDTLALDDEVLRNRRVTREVLQYCQKRMHSLIERKTLKHV